MPDAFIYDHVRTPRGRGKVDGSLHEVTALNLASQALDAIKDRNELDPTLVDDVVLGVVDPVGEAGGDIARAAALVAGYGDTVAGVQINRFCASGLDAVNFAAAQIMSGQSIRPLQSRITSCRRASPPISSPPNTDFRAMMWTLTRSRVRGARRHRGKKAASAVRS